jgi:uncharacterized protein
MNHVSIRHFAEEIQEVFRAGDPDSGHRSTESAHVGRVREFYAAVAGDDYEAAGECLADDVVMELLNPGPTAVVERAEGRPAVLAAVRHNFEPVESEEARAELLVAQGDKVFLVGRDRGRWRATGAAYDVWLSMQLTFRDGRICRFRQRAFPGGAEANP